MIVKVCGMNEPENIRDVAALGVDLIGYIFYVKSPRNFHPPIEEAAFSFIGGQMGSVCVSVNATDDEFSRMLRYRPTFLQLHGTEPPALCRKFHRQGIGVIKTISVATASDLNKTIPYEGMIDYFLFDTKCDTYGGSGRSFDWAVLDAYTGQTPFLLSGGLRPEAVEVITRFRHPRFAGIDLNSGFETSPGLKDIAILRTFLNSLSSA
ncbi:MAG: phosphoribosylanthranilate isomerase [Tannerellaceae bacterium]|jgi:phosphoribosylanthranilate isomerase|nr:phosphoribosylanthranilate isomerase [Tannerellaceae bacterium]